MNKQNPASQNKELTTPPQTIGGFVVWIFKAIIRKRKWWLLPVWALLVALALILFLGGQGAILPVIYMAF